ncbi:TPA: hypothetical protein ACL4FA_000729 [Streptococcus pneumoniae]
MARHDKSDFKTINKIERYFICHDTNDTSGRSACQRKRAASEILMMTSSVMPR